MDLFEYYIFVWIDTMSKKVKEDLLSDIVLKNLKSMVNSEDFKQWIHTYRKEKIREMVKRMNDFALGEVAISYNIIGEDESYNRDIIQEKVVSYIYNFLYNIKN